MVGVLFKWSFTLHVRNEAINYADCFVSRSSRYHGDQQQQQQNGQDQVVGRKNSQTVINTNDANSFDLMNQSRPNYFNTGGLSAWAMIIIFIIVILLGMAGYYGIMCYPLICRKDERYDIMERASTSSGGTPIRVTEYEKYDNEKQGNYSSRSTTPSKSHE